MFNWVLGQVIAAKDRQRIAIALGKGGAMMHSRSIDLRNPATWEFSGFSQNGEDGILDVLRKQLKSSNRYFVELASADGVENNTAWLLVAEKYNGLMIEGDPRLVARARKSVIGYSVGAECLNMFATRENVKEIRSRAAHADPDVFSLDIDGIDYYIADALLENGVRPKIFVVEYNSVYGEERSLTVPYKPDFSFTKAHPTQLYYGVSIAAWRKFFAKHGYRFVTVERNGVNAFFVDPKHFDTTFLDQVNGLGYAENQYQFRKFQVSSGAQFEKIAAMPFVEP